MRIIGTTIMLCLSLLLFLNIAPNASAATLCMPNMSVKPGSNIEIPVTVDDASGIRACDFIVGYDPSVLNCTGETAGDLTSGWKGASKQYKRQIKWLQYSDTPLTKTGGSLSKLQCNVVGSAGSQTKVCLQSAGIFDERGDKISSTNCDCADLKVVVTIGDLYTFFINSVDDGKLAVVGPTPTSADGKLGAFGNMLKEAAGLIDKGYIDKACKQLGDAFTKTDGIASPPDFIGGPAAAELAMLIRGLMDGLGCE